MKYKEVLKYGFYEMVNAKDEYIMNLEGDYSKVNTKLILYFLRTFLVMINPIIPHFTEYIYDKYLMPVFKSGADLSDIIDSNDIDKFLTDERGLAFAKFPEVVKVDYKQYLSNRYIKNLIETIKEHHDNIKNKNKSICLIKHFHQFSEDQKVVYSCLRSIKYDDNLNPVDDYKELIKTEMEGKFNKEIISKALQLSYYLTVSF